MNNNTKVSFIERAAFLSLLHTPYAAEERCMRAWHKKVAQ